MINPIRFGGIASGMDTETMVKQMMQAERIPMDRIFQQKQWAEWQRDAYRDVNKQLLEFRNLASDMRLQGTFLANKVSSTNDSIATAKGSGAAANFAYDLKVLELAENGYANSKESIGNEFDAKDKSALASLAGLTPGTEEVPGQTTSFKINGKEFTVGHDKSLNDLVKEINGAKIGVSAFYDAATQKVSFASTVTGEGKLEIDDTDGFLADVLKIDTADIKSDANPNGSFYAGKDAKFVLNGLETTRSSNTFTISGVEFSLKAEGSTRVSSTADTDKVFDTIKNFVDKYNELLTKSNEQLVEKRYRNYKPLTAEQKADMSDKEIELWDEKAKSGLLRGDSMLSGIMSDMRSLMSNDVKGLDEGAISALFEIGIQSNSYEDRGFLHIDEKKLRKAIEEKPQEVIDLFTKQSKNKNEQGIGTRLYTAVNDSLGSLVEKAGRPDSTVDQSFISKEIKRYDEQLAAFERRLFEVENRYWAQFTAMENALSSMNSQGNSLTSMLSQL